jgi:acyl-CoA hydrolase
MVIVALGGNDFLRQRPASAVKTALRELLGQIRAVGALPVLVAVPRVSVLRGAAGLLVDADLYAELAAEEQVLLVDELLSELLSRPELRADQVHLNAEGYRLLSSNVADRFKDWGLLNR